MGMGSVTLYPNPTTDILLIDWSGFSPNVEIEVKIIDLLGRSLITTRMMSSENSIDVSHLAKGAHVFLAQQNSNQSRQRFVKK